MANWFGGPCSCQSRGLSCSPPQYTVSPFSQRRRTMATAPKLQPNPLDPVKLDPKHYKVEFENDRVRVLRINYGPGEKSVMHSHPESIGVFLTDAHAKFTYPDGKSEDIKAKAGSVL